ncbi:hypothetical protein [Bdellovibrio sp. HCB2-146]|uniref:hypothetical protein n=1 Tax=Bdellovibrio sp. HCB2-146 TaxID=3394362 RepID=UPI0039BD19B8
MKKALVTMAILAASVSAQAGVYYMAGFDKTPVRINIKTLDVNSNGVSVIDQSGQRYTLPVYRGSNMSVKEVFDILSTYAKSKKDVVIFGTFAKQSDGTIEMTRLTFRVSP